MAKTAIYLFAGDDPAFCSSRIVFAKVGLSENPLARLASVQTGCPIRLQLVREVWFPTRFVARRAELAIHNGLEAEGLKKDTVGEWVRGPLWMIDEIVLEECQRTASQYASVVEHRLPTDPLPSLWEVDRGRVSSS